MLVGMVVNNAIVLVDYTNQLRGNSGCTCDEALMMAGPSRLKPILMTTLTTIIGMLPMAFALGSGMESQQPIGYNNYLWSYSFNINHIVTYSSIVLLCK